MPQRTERSIYCSEEGISSDRPSSGWVGRIRCDARAHSRSFQLSAKSNRIGARRDGIRYRSDRCGPLSLLSRLRRRHSALGSMRVRRRGSFSYLLSKTCPYESRIGKSYRVRERIAIADGTAQLSTGRKRRRLLFLGRIASINLIGIGKHPRKHLSLEPRDTREILIGERYKERQSAGTLKENTCKRRVTRHERPGKKIFVLCMQFLRGAISEDRKQVFVDRAATSDTIHMRVRKRTLRILAVPGKGTGDDIELYIGHRGDEIEERLFSGTDHGMECRRENQDALLELRAALVRMQEFAYVLIDGPPCAPSDCVRFRRIKSGLHAVPDALRHHDDVASEEVRDVDDVMGFLASKTILVPCTLLARKNEAVDDIVDVREITHLRARQGDGERRTAQIHLFETFDDGAIDANALTGSEDVVEIRDGVRQIILVADLFNALRICRFRRGVR